MRKVIKGLLFAAGVAALAVPAAIASAGTFSDGGETTPFIVGGNDATETYSFMAALSSSEGWGCGASLIRPTWIVTAAHCVTGDNDKPSAPGTLSFRIGSLSQSSGGTVAKAKRVIRYDAGNNDLALVELTAPVSQKPINVATSAPVGTSTRIIGWGCTKDPGCQGAKMLQQLDTSILADSACGGGKYYLCINNVDGWRGACYGDSGGPAVIKAAGEWALVGATSGGTGKCGENPSFYVDLPHVRSWIVSHAGPDDGGKPNPPAATNLALNRPATSKQSSCASGEAPAKAVNGSTKGGRTDKWCSTQGATKSIEIDLGAAKPLTKLVVQHAAAGGESAAYNTRNFVLETSAGDGTWSTAVTIANNTAATTTHPVNVTAHKIRLTTTDPVARIYEIEAY